MRSLDLPATKVAIIGGSGLETLLRGGKEFEKATAYGKAQIFLGELGGVSVAFLSRHGTRHQIPPSEINYRANLFALHELGVERILATNAVGAIRRDFRPGDLVVPNDIVDMTRTRATTFFDTNQVVHVDVTDPYCPEMREVLIEASKTTTREVREEAVMAATEGPRFETPAEIRALRVLGCDVVGMTSSPEVFLARELEICYATLCYVSNMAAGMQSKLTVKEGIGIAADVLPDLNHILELAVSRIRSERNCGCSKALALGMVP